MVSEASLTPAESGDRGDVQVLAGQLAAGDDLVDGAQGGFHHAAGVGEDVGRAGRKPQRGVHFLVRQAGEIDARQRGSSAPIRAW